MTSGGPTDGGRIDDDPTEDVLLARAYLSRVTEPASIPVWQFVASRGPAEAVAAIRSGVAPADVLAASAARADTADPQADLDAAARHGIRLVVPESREWPHFAFSALERTAAARARTFAAGERAHAEFGEPIPPLALWVRGPGDLAALGVRSAGIVGARAATGYGEHVAADLAYGLANRGFAIVSGGAYGIDAMAHRAALGAGGETVIVSAGGLDRPYPAGNAALFDQAAREGLVISESPPGAAPQRRRFLTRNRIIAALSTGTVVVEASRRSGAINTAGHCRRLERPLMAVPGPVTSPASAGCHWLLSDDARTAILVTGVDDVVAIIGSSGDVTAVPTAPVGRGRRADTVRARLDELDERSRLVFDGVPARRPAHPAEIAAACGLTALEVIRSLPTLELCGLIEAGPEGYAVVRDPDRRLTARLERSFGPPSRAE